MAARWLKLTLSYDGRLYAGWQVQPDKPTVQGTLEAAWRRLTQESLRVSAAGRTDAGVHALGQVVGLSTETRLTNDDVLRGLNALLPDDIVVVSVADAREGFHATYDAVGKRYRYRLYSGRVPPVFDRYYAWHYPHFVDVVAMHAAGQALVGQHDFSSFEAAGSERPNSIRTVSEVTVRFDKTWSEREPPIVNDGSGGKNSSARGLVTFDICGDGFLYNMVRIIVGTLVEVGAGKRAVDWPAEVLAAKDRRRAGQTAPAHGLFLMEVSYAAEGVRPDFTGAT